MKTYEFPLVLTGDGDNADKAWDDACEGFHVSPGLMPEDFSEVETIETYKYEYKLAELTVTVKKVNDHLDDCFDLFVGDLHVARMWYDESANLWRDNYERIFEVSNHSGLAAAELLKEEGYQ